MQKSGNNAPAISSALVFATLQCFNILVLLKIFEKLLDFKILEMFNDEIVAAFSICLVVLNSVFVINKKSIEPIFKKLDSISEEQHKKNWHLTLSYMIGSFLMVLILPIFI